MGDKEAWSEHFMQFYCIRKNKSFLTHVYTSK